MLSARLSETKITYCLIPPTGELNESLRLLRENRDGKAVGALAICIPDALHLLQKQTDLSKNILERPAEVDYSE